MKYMTTMARVGLGVASGALAATALAGQASAAEPSDEASGERSSLSATERAELDSDVSETLQNTNGGKRISPNQIAWKGGDVVMTFPLPGEKRARTLDEPIGTQGAGCEHGEVCLYEDAGWKGRQLTFYKCEFEKLRWYNFTNQTSSWINDQTKGTRSTLYYWDGKKVRHMTSLVAKSWESQVDDNDRADFVRVC